MGYRVEGGQLWHGPEAVPTPEEQDYLDVLGAPWIAPEQRTDTVRLSLDTEVERTKRTGAPPRWGWYDGDARRGWWAVAAGDAAV